MSTKKTLIIIGSVLGLIIAIGLFNRYFGPKGSPCDKKSAYALGNEAFRSTFPADAWMNFPFYSDSLVTVEDDNYTMHGRTVVNGNDMYEFTVEMGCLPRGLRVREVNKRKTN